MRQRTLFPSPVYFDQVGDDGLRAALRDALLAEAGDARRWQSAPDLLTRSQEPFPALSALLMGGVEAAVRDRLSGREASVRLESSAMASVIRPGQYRAPRRQGAHWVGLYFVDAGDQDAERLPDGSVSFLDPRGALGPNDPLALFSSHHELAPVDGLLLLFPGWLPYHMPPYAGKRPRVVVSLSVMLRPAAD